MGFLWVDDHPGCMVKSIRTCYVKKNKEKKRKKCGSTVPSLEIWRTIFGFGCITYINQTGPNSRVEF